MQQPKRPVISTFEPPHVSLQSYVIGFVTCVFLTLFAYVVAVSHWFDRRQAVLFIAAIAIVQSFVQLTRFLHLGHEFKPRYKLMAFGLMLVIVLIFIVGSLWIMDNLNYRMMESPSQMNQYMQGQDGL